MGFAITWYAIREPNAEQFLQSLDLSPTGETSEFPDSLIATAKLDTGWRVLWYNKYLCPFLREKDLRRISTGYDVLMCLIEEHVMASSAELWSGGKRKWWLSHQGDEGPKGLDTEGELPDAFAAIQHEMEQLQLAEGGDNAGVDYIFEIPLKAAQSFVGFKHDEDCPHLVDKQFVALSRTGPAGGFLRRLFGKKGTA
jgi:hypothetical protein